MSDSSFDITDMMDKNVTQTIVQETPLGRMARCEYDLDARTIWLADIETETGDWFRMVMWWMERQDPTKPIFVWINSPGGSVASMYQIHDCIVGSPCKVVTIGHGEIVSAAVLIFVAGHERLVTESCVFMSHEGADMGGGGGLRHSEAKDRRKYEDWLMSHWNVLMARRTPYDAAHWKAITTRKAEFWLLGGHAIIEYGIADAIHDPAGRLSQFAPATPVEEEAE